MIAKLAILAEASPTIGTGHVCEAFAVARAAMDARMDVALWLNAATPKGLLVHAPVPPVIVDGFDDRTCGELGPSWAAAGFDVALVNLRRADNAQVTALQSCGTSIVCVDELGGRRLDCAAVVNNSPLAASHRYESAHPAFRLYAGPEYMALQADFQSRHAAPRSHVGPLREIAITFGGTDRIATTLRVAEALLSWRSDVRKHIVVGSGFERRADLVRLLRGDDRDQSFEVHENLPTLAPLLSRCAAALTCGGNTLYELACLGTPARTLYEEPHEREIAGSFEARGFGVCLGPGRDADPGAIRHALDVLDDPTVRQREADAGKQLVDGRGAVRILEILNDVAAPGARRRSMAVPAAPQA